MKGGSDMKKFKRIIELLCNTTLWLGAVGVLSLGYRYIIDTIGVILTTIIFICLFIFLLYKKGDKE